MRNNTGYKSLRELLQCAAELRDHHEKVMERLNAEGLSFLSSSEDTEKGMSAEDYLRANKLARDYWSLVFNNPSKAMKIVSCYGIRDYAAARAFVYGKRDLLKRDMENLPNGIVESLSPSKANMLRMIGDKPVMGFSKGGRGKVVSTGTNRYSQRRRLM